VMPIRKAICRPFRMKIVCVFASGHC
jgi:hypothetical protein